MMIIKLYQIDPDYDHNNVRFMCMDNLERRSGSRNVDPPIYREVFVGVVPAGNLEEVYCYFNSDNPRLDGYKGRSMSVSDVVAVKEYDVFHYYYCDSIGFEQIAFDPEQTIGGTLL